MLGSDDAIPDDRNRDIRKRVLDSWRFHSGPHLTEEHMNDMVSQIVFRNNLRIIPDEYSELLLRHAETSGPTIVPKDPTRPIDDFQHEVWRNRT